MYKNKNISIFISFVCLWLASYLNNYAQNFIGFAVILTFGILHGANDIVLIQKINFNTKTSSFVKILMIYILIVIFGALCFYFIPFISLILFIFVSAYHFGEQNWEVFNHNQNNVFKTFYLFYGLLIFAILFYFNDLEVQKIIFDITSIKTPLYFFGYSLLSMIIIYLFLSYSILKNKNLNTNELLSETFYLIIFSIIFKNATLIWGFAIYFIVWHSLPSIYMQIDFLYGDFNLKNLYLYLKQAFVYWLISLIGIFVIWLTFSENDLFYSLFFSFIAAITFQHAFTIFRMFQKRIN